MPAGHSLQLRLDAKRRARYEAAATKAGQKLEVWARDRLDRAVEDLSDVTPRTVRVPELELRRLGGKRFTGPDPKGGTKT